MAEKCITGTETPRMDVVEDGCTMCVDTKASVGAAAHADEAADAVILSF